jgi:uncharacterized protein (UPF0332 family)
MDQKFENCLARKQIYADKTAKNFVGKELAEAAEDLQEAKDALARQKYKWATIRSYYAQFHACRTLLFHEGYRERSHYCLIQAIGALFVEPGKIDRGIYKQFEKTKALREKADYELEYSRIGAETAFRVAEELVAKVKELI